MKYLTYSTLLVFALAACKKIEGEGGTSTIKGKVYVKNYNSLGNLVGEYDGAKEDVYIIYGEGDNAFDDKVECSYDGSFEFKYLEEGKYTIFAYEDCLDCDSGEKEVIAKVEITEKKSVVDAGTITIKK